MIRPRLWRCLSPLMLIFAVCAYSAAATKLELPSATQSLPFNTALGSGWTLADLDGDQKPDLAQSRSVAHNGDHLYRVDLELSGGKHTGSFTFSGPDSLELVLDAVDVDGDNDLDLVVSGRFFGQRLGVWINNGEGSFSRSASNLYPECFEKLSLSPSDPDPVSADSKAPERFFGGPIATGLVPPRFGANEAPGRSPMDWVVLFRVGPHHLRAPPAASLN